MSILCTSLNFLSQRFIFFHKSADKSECKLKSKNVFRQCTKWDILNGNSLHGASSMEDDVMQTIMTGKFFQFFKISTLKQILLISYFPLAQVLLIFSSIRFSFAKESGKEGAVPSDTMYEVKPASSWVLFACAC